MPRFSFNILLEYTILFNHYIWLCILFSLKQPMLNCINKNYSKDKCKKCDKSMLTRKFNLR